MHGMKSVHTTGASQDTLKSFDDFKIKQATKVYEVMFFDM